MANRVNDTEQRATERLLLIGSVVLITSLAFEALATTNAMPTVVADLGGDRWYSLAAGMVLAGQIVSTTVAGWWADKSGVRTPLFLGLTMFSAGALAAGLAPNLAVFVLGRAIQGLGSGLVMVPLYVMVGAMVSADRRPMFFAAFSFAWVLPSMIGPFIAGYIVDHWDWRPVFWLIVPIALVALLPLGPIVKRMPNPQPQDVTPPPAVIAALITGGGIVALQIAGGLRYAPMWIATGIGVILLAIGMPRLLPKGTFRIRPGVPAIVAMRVTIMGAMVGAEFFLPLVLDRVHNWEASQTGWAIALGSVTWTVGSWLQAKVHQWNHRLRTPFVGAITVLAGAAVAFTLPVASIPPFVTLVGWAFIGLGMGLAHSTSSDLSLAVTEQAHHGDVSASLQLADALGPALAMGLISVALSTWHHIGNGVAPYLPASSVSFILALLGVIAASRILGLTRRDTDLL
ncbi:MAG TPA: MFS transporter [Actinomyces sp.]|jgi:MFS family permease|nr:MFS transporter [Acidobacteriota bacterium]HHT40862.1 MFS transporter [Actinomyces sp.]